MASPQVAVRDGAPMLVGEALGAEEAKAGEPFKGRAGQLLTTLISRTGLTRDEFSIANAVWCRPPNNKLEGQPYEKAAVQHCKEAHLEPFIAKHKPSVIVPLGNVALSSICGTKGITEHRGYVSWDSFRNAYILPSVHPSFVMRGNGNYGGVLMHDLSRAFEIAQDGWEEASKEYTMDPGPDVALAWAQSYVSKLAKHPSLKLAFDIETPGKSNDEGEV